MADGQASASEGPASRGIAVPLQRVLHDTGIAMRDHSFNTCPRGLAESTEVGKGKQGRGSTSSADVGLHHAVAAQAQSNVFT